MKNFDNFVNDVFENNDQAVDFYGETTSIDNNKYYYLDCVETQYSEEDIVEMLEKIFNKIKFDVDPSFIQDKMENNDGNSELYAYETLPEIIYRDLNDNIRWPDIVGSFEVESLIVYVTKNGEIYGEYF